jgi:hypothetical protein
MTTHELYDLNQQTNLFTVEEIGEILTQTIEDQSLRPPNGKTAILVDKVVKFGLARMYEMRAEAEKIASHTQVFFHLKAALNWLGDDLVPYVRKAYPDIG